MYEWLKDLIPLSFIEEVRLTGRTNYCGKIFLSSLIPVSQNYLSSYTPAPSLEDKVEVQEKIKGDSKE